MKKIFILPLAALLFFSSCKEKNGPFINFSNTNAAYKDTTYVTAVETPQAHNVLIEDFTGVTCPNCPGGHDVIAGMVSDPQNAGRINVLSIYPFDFAQAYPVPGYTNQQDFRTDKGTQIDKTIYGAIGLMPSAGVDRAVYNNAVLLYSTDWPAAVAARLSTTSLVNLKVTSSYDNATHKASVTATVAFTQDLPNKQNLSIAIVEDGIVGVQDNQGDYDTAYTFTNVFRDFVTTNIPYGDAFLSTQTTIPAGTVYAKTIYYTVSDANLALWKLANCKVVAFVNYTNSDGQKDVLQSASCKLVN